MQLSFEQLRAACLGAEQVLSTPEGLELHRFTVQEEQWYEAYHHRYKCESTAAIALQFWTDSPTLSVELLPLPGSTRSFWAAEVYEGGEKLGDMKNFDPAQLAVPYSALPFPLEPRRATFALKGGSQVRIQLPWSVKAVVREVSLADGAGFRPVSPARRILSYGDSITHGYDARFPGSMYTVQLARQLDAEVINKAIGGEYFQPELAALAQPRALDLITVAYGTNDWSHCPRDTEQMLEACRDFYRTLAAKFPGVPILAITPIWRVDMEPNHHGPFSVMSRCIHDLRRELPQLHPVEGLELMPHRAELTADLQVHPTDEGFAYYGAQLLERARQLL